ncbi:MAG: hypothetical protein V5A27_01035 [Halapricum sp.]
MTDNHGYSTPNEGSSDWHMPLNDNFRRIDTDVEVRDIESNLSEYQPNTGAKFLATDSGSIYIGDGRQWQQLGSVTSGQEMFRWGTPKHLQDVLDAAGRNSGPLDDGAVETVACVPGAKYTEPITVPEGVHLYTNGVTFDIDRDVDVWTLDSGCAVYGTATINVDSVSSYTSSAILIDANQATSTPIAMGGGQTNIPNMTGHFRLIGDQPSTSMDPQVGAAIELRGGADTGNYITHCYLGNFNVRGFNNACLANATDTGWQNDNFLSVDAHNCNYFWHHCNNQDSTEGEAKWQLVQSHVQGDAFQHAFWNETDEKSVRFYGHVEDPQRFRDHIIRGPKMKIQATARANWSTKADAFGQNADKADWGVGTTYNSVGFLEGNGESPSVVTNGKEYWGGEMVAFKDTGDGSGDGLYMKGPWQETIEWIQLSDETVAPAGGNE